MTLSKVAFGMKRRWLKYSIVRHLAQFMYTHKYKSAGIEKALQKAFGYGLLFGYDCASTGDRVRVGVVACAPTRRLPLLFTNYTRDLAGQGEDRRVFCLNSLLTDNR